MYFRLIAISAIIVLDNATGGIMSNMKNEQVIDNWESFEDSEVYKRFIEKSEPTSTSSSEAKVPELEVHNNIDTSYQKTVSTIRYFLKSALGKFSNSGKWKVEIWLDNESSKRSDNDEVISCGVALKRPGTGVLYARKASENLSRAISNSLEVLEDAVIGERKKWKTAKARNNLKRSMLWR